MSGRPHALDDVKQAEVCALVAAGVSLTAAARYVGCNRGTIRREQLRNEEFAHSLRRCEMKAEFMPLEAMHNAIHTHWRAAAWLLEHTRPQKYSRDAQKASRDAAQLVKLETVHDLVERLLEILAAEMGQLAYGDSAYRRLKRAIQDTCRELTAAATVNREPKRLRKVIAGMSTDFKYDEKPELICMADLEAIANGDASANQDLLQNTMTAAK